MSTRALVVGAAMAHPPRHRAGIHFSLDTASHKIYYVN